MEKLRGFSGDMNKARLCDEADGQDYLRVWP